MLAVFLTVVKADCMDRRAAILLAEFLCDGEWTTTSAARRIRSAVRCGNRAKWPSKLVDRVFSHPAFSAQAPTVRALATFLREDEEVEEAIYRSVTSINNWAREFSQLDRPAPRMQPSGVAARDWHVPAIVTPGQLAEKLGTPVNHLDWLADVRGSEHSIEGEKLRNYRYHWIRKSSGGLRLLEAPKSRLKQIQRWIADEILSAIPPHEAAHAFRCARSPITAAVPHVAQNVVMRIDLCDFFPSIKASRVAGIFRTAGYPPKVTRLLTGLCTNSAWRGVLDEVLPPSIDCNGLRDPRYAPLFAPHLPQGSPASPSLANLSAWSLDCRLAGLARKQKVNYTRYADDLVFSGDRSFGRQLRRFRILVNAICLDEGLEIRKRKTTVMRAHQQQQVTGIVINTRPTIARKDYDQLKAILHNCVRLGAESQNRDRHADFRSHLAGRVAWVTAVDRAKGIRLQKKLNAIQW